MTEIPATEQDTDFVWRVTYSEDDGFSIEAGERLSNVNTEGQLYVIGKSLINLGTRLLTSSAEDDEEA